MTGPFEHLFAPLKVGPMTLRNRIVVPPHGVSFTSGFGNTIERVIDYHVERARGGAAMITMSNFVMPPSWQQLGTWGDNLATTPFGTLDMASDPALLPAYRRLATAIHEQGATFVVQLNTTGRQYWATGMVAYGLPLVAPSPLPCPRMRQIPREMTIGDIEEFIETFAVAAANMQEAGTDGVEILAAQGYLLSEFLSPHTNQRTDRYGGTLENRMRFLVEALAAIRKRTGAAFALGVRMNGDDFAPGGLTLADTQEIAARLRATGLVDYLNISGMTYHQYPAWIADMAAPEATFADQAAAIRRTVPGLPICVVTRIGSPELGERLVASGQTDMVGMARALISDPELPNKARRGDSDDIRRCTYSNQSCSMGQTLGRGVGCLHNTAVGKEAQLGIGKMKPAARRKRVVVVGGGPAGMAAARVATERGHEVVLFEKDERLGGQNLMTQQIASRRGFAEVTRWQEHRLRKLGVEIRLGSAATIEAILTATPDAVIVATGSTPRRSGHSALRPDVPRLPGVEQANVLTVWDVFQNPDRVGARVLLIDEDPHLAGLYTAEHLADLGRQVEIVTADLLPLREMHINYMPEIYRRVRPKGVTIRTDTLVTGIDGSTVHGTDRYTNAARLITGIDTIVLAMGNEVNDGLAHALKGKVGELHIVGDCLAPRKIEEAILDGERAGWML